MQKILIAIAKIYYDLASLSSVFFFFAFLCDRLNMYSILKQNEVSTFVPSFGLPLRLAKVPALSLKLIRNSISCHEVIRRVSFGGLPYEFLRGGI